ncbi:CoA transferase subunit A [Sneathiella chinensis]|uniref:CoA synthetase n=1 Tax=Sneathiella chinensis TaxID=349750 RepID=A0ABQ5U018_9PROT|nr:CoA-transferase [Sneathiella chinensis]GLQ05475.1 CoA synthetase [Sneathiella chinensis]
MIYSIEDLIKKIPNGAKIAVPSDYAGVAMEATREIIRQGISDLHLVGIPTSGLQSELLIGAGLVKTFESSALTLGEYNPPPRFNQAVKDGTIKLVDATCPAIHAALQASQKGLPFMPLRGIIGSDILTHHPDWKVIDNPFADNDPIVAIPAIRPDVALFHAPLADRNGNVWAGRRRELVNMTQASKTALITVEKITDTPLLEDETMAAGVIPDLYVGGVAHCPKGTWPLAFWQGDGEDSENLSQYRSMARSQEGFDQYLNEFVFKGGK